MKRLISITMILITVVGNSYAGRRGDDLEPSEGVFSWVSAPEPYYVSLRELLIGEHAYRHCQMVVLPSFSVEWAVYMTRDGKENNRIIFNVLEEPLWTEMARQIEKDTGRPNPSFGSSFQSAALSKLHPKVKNYTAVISCDLADLLDKVWYQMLGRVHYFESNMAGADGVGIYISHWEEGKGFRSGETWSPTENSPTGQLVAIGAKMRDLSMANDHDRTNIQAEIMSMAKALLQKINNN